jgi:hypothetical protein
MLRIDGVLLDIIVGNNDGVKRARCFSVGFNRQQVKKGEHY